MKKEYRLLITIGIMAGLLLGFYFITGAISKYTGFFISNDVFKDDFENCLKNQDISLYINSNDVLKTLDKIDVKEHLDKVDIMNCLRNKEYCEENQVNEFPTWIINNERINRDITIFELERLSGCE